MPAHPILDAPLFPREILQARNLEDLLARVIFVPGDAANLAQRAGINPALLDLVSPAATVWARILDVASSTQKLGALLDILSAAAVHPDVKAAVAAVRAVNAPGGALHAGRLMLSGKRPFLARKTLRELLPELQDWDSRAAILVVRGAADTGRTETQTLLFDGNPDRFVHLVDTMPLGSSLRAVWKAAGAEGAAPVPGHEPLSTQDALLSDFWTDVQATLEDKNRRLWVLFDDLDKGPGRVEVRALAEALAIRLASVTFQKRIRMVLLGYPAPELPEKVPLALVCNDTTEELEVSHVEAFLDFCLAAARKNFDPATLPVKAKELHDAARAGATPNRPFAESLNLVLTRWHAQEIR